MRAEATIRDEAGELVVWYKSLAGRQDDPDDYPQTGPRRGQIKIGFHNHDDVFARVPAFLERLRAHLAADAALEDASVQLIEGGPPTGQAIDFKVRGRSPEAVGAAADALAAHLEARPGVMDLEVGDELGAPQLVVTPDPARAAAYGLREAHVAAAARAALEGVTAVSIPVEERATDVVVRLAGLERADRDRVGDLPVATPDGRVIRLRQVAEVRRARELAKIQRVDGQRALRLAADVDRAHTTPEAEAALIEAVAAQHPGVSLHYGGQLADSAESFSQLPSAFALAVAMIFAVLAVQFKSYVQPLIILSAIPLGVAGMVLGLFVLGMDLSFIAAVGGVGLVGIVVNDSLVLVDFVNRIRARGVGAREAVIEASLTRLRPILITTVTTVLGLGPLALGLAGEEPLLAPMAVSISFGLTFSTAFTLVAVPVLYLLADDLTALTTRRGSSPPGAPGASGSAGGTPPAAS